MIQIVDPAACSRRGDGDKGAEEKNKRDRVLPAFIYLPPVSPIHLIEKIFGLQNRFNVRRITTAS